MQVADMYILETGTLSGKVGALLGENNVIGRICGQISSLLEFYIFEWTLSLS